MTTYQTHDWQKLSPAQRNAARQFVAQLADKDVQVSVSKVGKHLDAVFAWSRGEMPLDELTERF